MCHKGRRDRPVDQCPNRFFKNMGDECLRLLVNAFSYKQEALSASAPDDWCSP